jgi:hypothetical protein
VLVNPVSTSLMECNTTCVGNVAEFCGGNNRILIYNDTAWVNITREELAQETQILVTLLTEVQGYIQAWSELISQYQSSISGSSKVRRQADNSALVQQIAAARQQIVEWQQWWSTRAVSFM